MAPAPAPMPVREAETDASDGISAVTDAFDSLVHLERSLRERGAAAGAAAGRAVGVRMGREKGFAEGVSYGMEREFYRGGAKAILSLIEAHPGVFTHRAITAANDVVSRAESSPLHVIGNDENTDVIGEQERLRQAFRLMCALAKLPPVKVLGGRAETISF